MQIETLKVFCDIVETGSFSESGKRNSITQSAVSQQIRSLEKRFGVAFFERGKKNFAMTAEGEVFEAAAREMLEIFDEAQSIAGVLVTLGVEHDQRGDSVLGGYSEIHARGHVDRGHKSAAQHQQEKREHHFCGNQ